MTIETKMNEAKAAVPEEVAFYENRKPYFRRNFVVILNCQLFVERIGTRDTKTITNDCGHVFADRNHSVKGLAYCFQTLCCEICEKKNKK